LCLSPVESIWVIGDSEVKGTISTGLKIKISYETTAERRIRPNSGTGGASHRLGVNIIKYAALNSRQSEERQTAKCFDFAAKDKGSLERSREKLVLRVGSLFGHEFKVLEQDRGKCAEGQTTDWDSNQPYPSNGKDIFPGTVTASTGVNAVRSSEQAGLRLEELSKTFR
jgi:hypothetical protein